MLSKCFFILTASRTCGDQKPCRCSAHALNVLGINVWGKGRARWRKRDRVGEWRDCAQGGVACRPEQRLAGLVWKDGGRPPSPSLFSAGPAPLFQLRA